MPRMTQEKMARLAEALRNGAGIRQAALFVPCSTRTVTVLRPKILGDKCPCGEPINHRGMCFHRRARARFRPSPSPSPETEYGLGFAAGQAALLTEARSLLVAVIRNYVRKNTLRQSHRLWTAEETARLAELWTNSSLGSTAIAQQLGRSVDSVKSRVRDAGIRPRPLSPYLAAYQARRRATSRG